MSEREEFWKSKLKAFLHDPPCKCLDLGSHEAIAAQFKRSIGFAEGEEFDDVFTKVCDRTAAAADRFLFPKSSVMHSRYDGTAATAFHHPFCDGVWYDERGLNVVEAEKIFQTSIGIADQNLSWQQRYMLYWRRWPEESAKLDARVAFLPADTRIPDHTIWNHNSLTSAFRGCYTDGVFEPSFLLFQIGPVQSFIECAKSTRDCWSGSYILSWLMSKALSAIAMEIGPDSVIFPALRGQPFFDYAMKEIYSAIKLENDRTLWDAVAKNIGGKMRIPTLPNRFLVLCPASRAKELAQRAELAIREEWHRITEFAWKEFSAKAHGGLEPWRKRWQEQTEQFLQVQWQTMNWDESLCDEALMKMASEIPEKERDPRNGNNIGNSWNMQYNRVSRAFAARRMLREFAQYTKPDADCLVGAPKDALSGVEEVIGSEALWEAIRKGDGDLFKENDGPYGAITLTKRYFPLYLKQEAKLNLDFGNQQTRIASTREIAGERKYFAVLAMDGDQIGARLSGHKGRLFKDCLSKEAHEYIGKLPAFKDYQRAMSPAAHTQFSECLSNFALHLVEPVITAFGGQLIYAGGDDVLAMVPAGKALAAAVALRSMFRGEYHPALMQNVELAYEFSEKLLRDYGISEQHHGWVTVPSGREKLALMVPGTECDVSCGIAIAHSDYPLQRTIHEARMAEARAKNVYKRGAFSMSLLKRSGEIIQWGGKWESPAVELYYTYLAQRNKDMSARLPYTLSQVLAPYALDKAARQSGIAGERIIEIIMAEFRELCSRQWLHNPPLELAQRELAALLAEYGVAGLANFAKLFLSVAFIYRDPSDDLNNEDGE